MLIDVSVLSISYENHPYLFCYDLTSLFLPINNVTTTLAILTKVPPRETRIVKKPLGIRNPIGISPIKVKTIKH